MRKILTSFSVFLVIFLGFFAAVFTFSHLQDATESKDLKGFNRNLQNYNSKLQVVDNSGKQLCQFNVAIADNDQKRSYGLMNLDEMPQQNGMIFFFEKEAPVTMWMKDTRISLDIIFINKNDVIANIKNDAKPMSLAHIFSEKKVSKALEINAGQVKKCGIKIGQKVIIRTAK